MHVSMPVSKTSLGPNRQSMSGRSAVLIGIASELEVSVWLREFIVVGIWEITCHKPTVA